MMTANYEYLAECDETLTAELKELQDQDILQGMMAEAAAVTSLPRSTLAEQCE